MKIAIIGYGVVGQAVDASYKNTDVRMSIVDPNSEHETCDLPEACSNADALFVCVPTPADPTDGSVDGSILYEVLSDLQVYAPGKLVILKSTITPDWLQVFSYFNMKLVYSPEFLREHHSKEDYLNSKTHILACDQRYFAEACGIMKRSKCISQDYKWCNIGTASLAKYAINSFLAMKVVFMNELKDIYDRVGTPGSWEELVELMQLDERIGDSHMQVPGPDGERGFGGMCFPKDSLAFLKYANKLGVDATLVQQARNKNAKYRSNDE